jgi:hypothetical protein
MAYGQQPARRAQRATDSIGSTIYRTAIDDNPALETCAQNVAIYDP